MPVGFYVPRYPLNQFIECLWYVDEHVPYNREKILPTGTVELMINFGSPHRLIDKTDPTRFSLMRSSWIAGLQTAYLINEPVAETCMMGVRFKPGGAFPFLDITQAELRDTVLTMDLLWGRYILEVRDRLRELPTMAARFRLLEQILMQRLRDDLYGLDAVQYAVQQITQIQDTLSIKDLSAALGMSQKHLNQQFQKMVGVSPKILARITRLQRALYSIDPAGNVNWVEIANRCHYYDQAHFNHDFMAFTGLQPSAYIKLRAAVFGTSIEQASFDAHFVPIG